MRVIFKSIEIEGFLSMGKATVDLEKQGLVYVVGKNNSRGNQESNGSGKSTIFEAIIYTLTGNTLRETKDVVNRYYPGGYCLTSLNVMVDGVDYVITRTRNHPVYKNNLLIHRDGEDISGGTLRKSESILKQELSQLTSSFISGIIIMGQGLPNRFTNLGPTARRERLEEFSQSSDFIEEIKTRIANFSSVTKSDLDNNRLLESKESTVVSMSTDQINSKTQELNDLENSVEVNQDNLEEKIQTLTEKLSVAEKDLEQARESKKVLENKVKSFNLEAMQYKTDMNNIDRDNQKLQKDVNSLSVKKCPMCEQYISSPEKVEELRQGIRQSIENNNSRKEEYSRLLSQTMKNLDVLNSKLKVYQDMYDEASETYLSVRTSIAELKSQKSDRESKIKQLNQNILEWRDKIENSTRKLNELMDESNKLVLKIDILDFLGKKVQKEFRNYLLIGVVDYLNDKLKYYSRELFGTEELNVHLSDNQLFIEYEGRQYENLSGGERQRADLAMQFSLRDLLVNTLGFNCNLLVIDEGFDNLDPSGVESLVKVISEMSSVESVFTVSHHTLSLPFDKVLMVNKGLDKVSYIE